MNHLLFGIHDEGYRRALVRNAELQGYNTTGISTLSDMLLLIATKRFQFYAMDANLGFPGSENVHPAVQAYAAMQATPSGKFIAIAGMEYTYDACKKEGIPALLKRDFSLSRFLEE